MCLMSIITSKSEIVAEKNVTEPELYIEYLERISEEKITRSIKRKVADTLAK